MPKAYSVELDVVTESDDREGVEREVEEYAEKFGVTAEVTQLRGPGGGYALVLFSSSRPDGLVDLLIDYANDPREAVYLALTSAG